MTVLNTDCGLLISHATAKAKKNHYHHSVQKLKSSNPSAWYREIRIMTTGITPNPTITPPPGVNPDNAKEVADSINNYFSSIAQHISPLDMTALPAYLPAPAPCPTIHEWDVYNQLKRINCRKAGGPDGVPARIIREFAPELATPLTDILNSSYHQGIVPSQWKQAVVVPIPKTNRPAWNSLRPVSLTDHFAKLAETYITRLILQDIDDKIDPNQFGNRKGVSTSHYLIKLMDNLYNHADSSKNHSTVVVTDFSKAFDLIDHNIVITKLLQLGTRPCVIPWVCSFLCGRSQCVRYKNVTSEYRVLQGGVPQGSKLGPLCFLAQINDAIQVSHEKVTSLKYVDDVTLTVNCNGPDNGNMQRALDEFGDWSVQNNMKLNPSKCMAMNVCFMKNPLRLTPLEICSQQLQIVDCVKILGVQISSDLKWSAHISNLIRRANSKHYMIKMLKKFHLSQVDLITIYKCYERSLLEYAVPVWNSGLTVKQVEDLERTQKRALRIILGASYTTYEDALKETNLTSLKERRRILSTKFATDLSKSKSFKDWLPKQRCEQVQYNLRNKNKLSQILCKTNRYKNSAISYFVKLLNENVL